MNQNRPTTRPIPVPDPASQPFFDAAAQGRLVIKFCPTCSRYLAPAAEACDACHAEGLEWREASGRGTLYSFVINHQVLHPGFEGEIPYNLCIIELDEGPRINGNYLGDNAALRVDMPLQVTFERVGDVTVPQWMAGSWQNETRS
jgi:uncharacterized OB-fold protein